MSKAPKPPSAAEKRVFYTADPVKARKILPAWFLLRMMERNGQYLLGMAGGGMGKTVKRILAVSVDLAGNMWLDAELSNGRKASINASQIAIAEELTVEGE